MYDFKKTINYNFSKNKSTLLYFPLFFLLAILAYLASENFLTNNGYVNCQKNIFLFFNTQLSKYPLLMDNLTQLGDALVILSFFTIFIIYCPKLWEDLITSSIISAILVGILKPLFGIQRPAAAFGAENLHIIGRKLMGNNSFPSGHSVTVFTVLTIIMLAFMPKKAINQIFWSFGVFFIGVILILTRLGVGAHHPLDVTVGATVGYISAILGLVINQKYNIWAWVCEKKFYPVFILIFVACIIVMIFKILNTNLIIFYFALISLLISLTVIIFSYVKK